MVEVSHKLFFIQKRRVCGAHPCAEVHHADATSFLAGRKGGNDMVQVLAEGEGRETLLIGMEVLDNLAHDKIVLSESGDIFEVAVASKEEAAKAALMEEGKRSFVAEEAAKRAFVEEWRPLRDDKIIR